MLFVSLLAVACSLVSAAAIAKDTGGFSPLPEEDPAEFGHDAELEALWALAPTFDFNVTDASELDHLDDEEASDVEERGLEKRKCFKTGEKFGNEKINAKQAASYLCYNYFAGTYLHGRGRKRCANLRYKSVQFTLAFTGPNAGASRHIGGKECLNGMLSEINSCSHGGATTYGHWHYRVDPNKKLC